MEEGIVWLLYLYQSLPHSLVEGVRLGIVEHQLHHVLKLISVCRHDVILAVLQSLKELGFDAIG